jgi:hypothetical protein
LCVYVCWCMYVCVCVCVRSRARVCMCLYARARACVCACAWVCVDVRSCMRARIFGLCFVLGFNGRCVFPASLGSSWFGHRPSQQSTTCPPTECIRTDVQSEFTTTRNYLQTMRQETQPWQKSFREVIKFHKIFHETFFMKKHSVKVSWNYLMKVHEIFQEISWNFINLSFMT